MDFETVQELFSASQTKKDSRDSDHTQEQGENNSGVTPPDNSPIRPKELDTLISDAVVFGDEDELEDIKELLQELKKHFDPNTEENDDEIPSIGGLFSDRSIILDSHQSDLRKLVGKFCNLSAWGGLMETDESVLKDAISADIARARYFDPEV